MNTALENLDEKGIDIFGSRKQKIHEALEDQETEGFGIFGKVNYEQQRLQERRNKMQKYVLDQGKLVELPEQVPMVQSVMTILEENSSGMLKKQDVAAAIQNYAETNNIVVEQSTQDAFVVKVYSNADVLQTGTITRKQLHQALEDQESEGFGIFGRVNYEQQRLQERRQQMQKYVLDQGKLVEV